MGIVTDVPYFRRNDFKNNTKNHLFLSRSCRALIVLITWLSSFTLGDSHKDLIAFGSCAKQYRTQQFWNNILQFQPDGWLWIGDAIYTNCSQPNCIREGYEMLQSIPEYQAFKKNVSFIDGIWDDHDYGVNDGGQEFIHKTISQKYFLDFLNVSKDSTRRTQDGVYTSRYHPIGNNHQKQKFAKLILLDTRTWREQPLLPSIGQYKLPLTSIIAALLRLLTSIPGFGWNHSADILGEAQWSWLEQELMSLKHDTEITIIVSSIQILTTIPIFESWGHFPTSKRRLFKLIQKTNPAGLIFLSGDVHLGQLSGQPNCVVEVTSSGLTHSILSNPFASSILTDVIFPIYQTKFDSIHPPNFDVDPKNRQFYEGRNFGTIEFHTKLNETATSFENLTSTPNVSVVATIHDIDGRPKLRSVQFFNNRDDNYYECLDRFPPVIPHRSTSEFIFYLGADIFLVASGIGFVFLVFWMYYKAILRHIRLIRRPPPQQQQLNLQTAQTSISTDCSDVASQTEGVRTKQLRRRQN